MSASISSRTSSRGAGGATVRRVRAPIKNTTRREAVDVSTRLAPAVPPSVARQALLKSGGVSSSLVYANPKSVKPARTSSRTTAAEYEKLAAKIPSVDPKASRQQFCYNSSSVSESLLSPKVTTKAKKKAPKRLTKDEAARLARRVETGADPRTTRQRFTLGSASVRDLLVHPRDEVYTDADGHTFAITYDVSTPGAAGTDSAASSVVGSGSSAPSSATPAKARRQHDLRGTADLAFPISHVQPSPIAVRKAKTKAEDAKLRSRFSEPSAPSPAARKYDVAFKSHFSLAQRREAAEEKKEEVDPRAARSNVSHFSLSQMDPPTARHQAVPAKPTQVAPPAPPTPSGVSPRMAKQAHLSSHDLFGLRGGLPSSAQRRGRASAPPPPPPAVGSPRSTAAPGYQAASANKHNMLASHFTLG